MSITQRHADAASSSASAPAAAPSTNSSGALSSMLRGTSFAEGEAMLAPVQAKRAPVQMHGGEGEHADDEAPDSQPAKPEAKDGDPPVTPKKEVLDADASLKVLNDAFGTYKTCVKGDVRLLDQAAFQVAYDAIYGATKYAWDPYVKNGPGNLEGFAYKGVNYINKDCTSIDTVPHEMLHNNAAADWKGTVGSEFNEGTTEYLTIKAVTKAGKVPSHSYPSQEACVKELIAQGLSEDTLMTAYFKGDAANLICKWADTNCTDTWANIMAALQSKDWATARAKMKKK